MYNEILLPIPTEEAPEPLQSAKYLYDGDGNLVKSVVNSTLGNTTTTYYPGCQAAFGKIRFVTGVMPTGYQYTGQYMARIKVTFPRAGKGRDEGEVYSQALQ